MGFKPFSVEVNNTKLIAQTEAHRLSSETVSPAHVLLALALGKDSVGWVLRQQSVDAEIIRKLLPVGSGLSDRAILDIEFSGQARVLMNVACNLSDSDDLKEVSNAHVLQALLLENAICSEVGFLKSLNVDIDTLRRRTDIILKLSSRESGADVNDVRKFADAPRLPSDEVAIIESKLAVADVFDDATVSIIETARDAARAHEQPFVRMDHLLAAFVKLGFWQEYVNELISLVRGEHLLNVNLIPGNCNNDSHVDFADDFKHVLLSARELKNINGDGLIEPVMLLYGMAHNGSLWLFKEDALDKLSLLAQRIRQDILRELEKLEVARINDTIRNFTSPDPASAPSNQPSVSLSMTERLVRVVRFAKAEAVLSGQPLVQAPHLVLALIQESFISEIAFVKERSLNVEQLRADALRALEIPARLITTVEPPSAVRLAPESRTLFLLARDIAGELRIPYIDLNHLAIALIDTEDWLRRLIGDIGFSTPSALVKRLRQCSLHQYFKLQGQGSDADLPKWQYVALDAIDDMEPLSPSCPQSSGKDRIEERLSPRSEVIMGYAVEASKKLKHSQISIESIMLGLLYETLGTTVDVFKVLGLNRFEAREVIACACYERISERTAALRPLSRNALKVMERAWSCAQLMKSDRIAPEHILLAIADESEGVASFVCEALMIDGQKLRAELITAMSTSKKDSDPRPAD
jgi:Clp amino terminal domain, pathogenicity island component